MILYYILQFSWGLLSNIIGGLFFLFCKYILKWQVKKIYNNFLIFPKDHSLKAGMSLGIFIFVDENSSLIPHEYGHSIQNIFFGPLFLFIIGIPSFIRCTYYNLKKKTEGYYNIWFERQASELGEKFYEIQRNNL